MSFYFSRRRKKRLQRIAAYSTPAAAVNDVLPSVTGTFTVGQTVTVSLGTWTGADSLAGSLRYVSDDTEIDTFTEDGTYLLADADFGEQLYLHVTAEPGGVTAESAATDEVTFADAFTRSDGDLANGWDYSATKWAVASNAVVATPAVGSTLIANGTMEAGDPPSNWTPDTSTLSSVADERTGGAGTKSMNAVRGSSNTAATQSVGTLSGFYRFSVYAKNNNATSLGLGGVDDTYVTNSTSWTHLRAAGAVQGGKSFICRLVGAVGTQGRFDDAVAVKLTTADVFAVRDLGTPDARVSVTPTITDSLAAGAVVCLDSRTTPLNFIVAYIGRTGAYDYIRVWKCVNGTFTALAFITTAVTYSAGAVLALEHAGTTVRVFYNGAQKGVDYTVSDAGIISNTKHGIFSSDAANTIASCEITPAEI